MTDAPSVGAPRGPLPSGNARRRNAPTIPKTEIPITGREGRAPRVPDGYDLGPAGKAWWKWAWKTPQSVAWDPGSHYAIARRASLEDERAAIGLVPELTVADILCDAIGTDFDDRKEMRQLEQSLTWMLTALQRRAGGIKSVLAEMRELDKRLGLDPRAVPELRWKFVDPSRRGGEDDTQSSSPSEQAMAQLFVLP